LVGFWWDVRIKACLDPTEVDPTRGFIHKKKSIAANGIYKKQNFRAAKRGKF
jgi:hypothetical protein